MPNFTGLGRAAVDMPLAWAKGVEQGESAADRRSAFKLKKEQREQELEKIGFEREAALKTRDTRMETVETQIANLAEKEKAMNRQINQRAMYTSLDEYFETGDINALQRYAESSPEVFTALGSPMSMKGISFDKKEMSEQDRVLVQQLVQGLDTSVALDPNRMSKRYFMVQTQGEDGMPKKEIRDIAQLVGASGYYKYANKKNRERARDIFNTRKTQAQAGEARAKAISAATPEQTDKQFYEGTEDALQKSGFFERETKDFTAADRGQVAALVKKFKHLKPSEKDFDKAAKAYEMEANLSDVQDIQPENVGWFDSASDYYFDKTDLNAMGMSKKALAKVGMHWMKFRHAMTGTAQSAQEAANFEKVAGSAGQGLRTVLGKLEAQAETKLAEMIALKKKLGPIVGHMHVSQIIGNIEDTIKNVKASQVAQDVYNQTKNKKKAREAYNKAMGFDPSIAELSRGKQKIAQAELDKQKGKEPLKVDKKSLATFFPKKG